MFFLAGREQIQQPPFSGCLAMFGGRKLRYLLMEEIEAPTNPSQQTWQCNILSF